MGRRGIVALCAALCLTACGSAGSAEPHSVEFFAMDTIMDVTVYGDEALPDQIREGIEDLERRISTTDPDSEIARLDRDGEGDVSEETAALLSRALGLCEDTRGALDITIYPVVRAWGFTTGEHRIPSDGELRELLDHVTWRRVRVEGTHVTLGPGTQIDLGAVAKGWAGARAADALRAAGVRSAILNLGGNVQTVGSKPDGSPWRIAVQDPDGGGYAGVLEIADQAAVTSGGYQRYFEEDGVTYWHIMDPSTGRPARSGLVSVTIVAEDGALCDALSTALFVMGPDEAVRYWRETGGFGMVLITEDGEVLVTPDLAYTPQPGAPYRVTTLPPEG